MFYDERIEGAKGRIAKNSIAMSVVIAIVFAALRVVNVLKNGYDTKHLWLVSIEFAVILAGVVCLCIGELKRIRTASDERITYEQAKFYNKAFPILIYIVLGIYSALLPMSLFNEAWVSKVPDIAFDSLPTILLFSVGIYVICSFRKSDIYFNYSLMDSDNYYKGVWKNIGKIATALGAMLLTSMCILVIRITLKQPTGSQILDLFVSLLLTYIFLIIKISALYLIYSALEKASYERKRFISKASIISLFVTIALQAVWSAFVIFVVVLPLSQANAVQTVLTASSMSIYILLALLIFLTYFGYEYQKSKPSKMVDISCKVILLSQVIKSLFENITNCITFIFLPDIMQNEAYIINDTLSSIGFALNAVFGIALIVGVAMLILALIKEKTIAKANIAAIIILAVLIGVGIFMQAQADALQTRIYELICELALLLYLSAIVVYIGKKKAV